MKPLSPFIIKKHLERIFDGPVDDHVQTIDGRRRYFPNRSEREFAVAAQQAGFSVLKDGWPDFMCIRDNEVIVVEVKSGNQELKDHQLAMMRILSAAGIRCYQWTRRDGFKRLFKRKVDESKTPR